MAPRLLVVALFLVLAAVGCGGGSNDSATSTPVSTSRSTNGTTSGSTKGTTSGKTTTSGQTTTIARPPHFTNPQYAQYQKDIKAFRKQNAAALNKVKVCAAPTSNNKGKLDRCAGPSLRTLYAVTVQLGRTLANYAGTASGGCAESLSRLIGYAIPYQASIRALRKVVKSENLTASYSAAANLQTAGKGGLRKAAAVDKDCKPPA